MSFFTRSMSCSTSPMEVELRLPPLSTPQKSSLATTFGTTAKKENKNIARYQRALTRNTEKAPAHHKVTGVFLCPYRTRAAHLSLDRLTRLGETQKVPNFWLHFRFSRGNDRREQAKHVIFQNKSYFTGKLLGILLRKNYIRNVLTP